LLCAASFSWAAARRPSAFVEAENDGPANYLPHVEKLSDRYRLTIDTPDMLPHYLIEKTDQRVWLRLMRPSTYPSQILQGDGVVEAVKLIRHRHSSDVIITLGPDATSSDVYFDDGRRKLVVDVMTSPYVDKNELPKPATLSAPKPKPIKKGPPQPIAVKSIPPRTPVAAVVESTAVAKVAAARPPVMVKKKEGSILIAVDAGHGGLDSGAIGARGTMEKDINLTVARALAKALEKEKNIQVLLTRNSDVLVPLQERTRMANEAGAHLFVSIHCNSSLSPKSTGFEAYYLSPGATDKAAAAVARQENSVVGLEANKGEHSSRLSEVLASMAVGNFINESSKFAAFVCRHVRQETSQDKTQSKEADFFVLRGAQMPSILLELEYVSNPLTELKLRSSRFQSQAVKAVVDGIKAYLQQTKLEREAMASRLMRSSANPQ
jgi:N-acetylmuramoyl-L-alanine amidase